MQIIITGGVQSGKSTLAAQLIEFLTAQKISQAGILAMGLWKDNLRQGFDLIDLKSGDKIPLARRRIDPDSTALTPYQFFDKGLAAGVKALDVERCRTSCVIMVDEVGKLELNGDGWSKFLPPLLSIKSVVHIWIVREKLVNDVCKKWNLAQTEIVHVNNSNALEKLKKLCMSWIKQKSLSC